MSETGLRVATLVFTVVSAAAGVTAVFVMLQIKNAILTERDLMKGWVLEEIRKAWS